MNDFFQEWKLKIQPLDSCNQTTHGKRIQIKKSLLSVFIENSIIVWM